MKILTQLSFSWIPPHWELVLRFDCSTLCRNFDTAQVLMQDLVYVLLCIMLGNLWGWYDAKRSCRVLLWLKNATMHTLNFVRTSKKRDGSRVESTFMRFRDRRLSKSSESYHVGCEFLWYCQTPFTLFSKIYLPTYLPGCIKIFFLNLFRYQWRKCFLILW